MMKRNKYIVVSGFRRSGTSSMMSALRECGIPIIGFKYPLLYRTLDGKDVDAGCCIPAETTTLTSNPTGYWEMPSITVTRLNSDTIGEGDGLVVKVTTEAMARSDFNLIDKVIMMVRNPRKIIDSQIKVAPALNEKKKKDILAWCLVTNFIVAINIVRKSSTPIMFVIYEKFIENPTAIMEKVCRFIGRGDAKYAKDVISPIHQKAAKINFDCDALKMADEIYNMCLSCDFNGLYNYDISKAKKAYDDYYMKNVKENNLAVAI